MSDPATPLRIDRCVCLDRTFAELLPLAQESSWGLEELATATGCSRRCGLCRPYLRRMLETGETVFREVLVESAVEREQSGVI